MSYDPHAVLNTLDQHVILVNALLLICFAGFLTTYVCAFKVAARHKTYPIPFAAAGFYAVHDAYFASEWDKWFNVYSHWWLELWAVSNFFCAILELLLAYQVFKYGREELAPRLTQRQFGLSLIACLIGITVVWVMTKQILNDDLCLIAFAFTTFWPQVWGTQLLLKRQSMRGQTRTMFWGMLASPVGMFSAWYFLDPYFRSPVWLCFAAVTILWAIFNLWLSSRFPKYAPESRNEIVPEALHGALVPGNQRA